MFDTHCHLNFSVFAQNVDEVITRARKVGVNHIVIPGTDVETSQRAIEIAEKYENIYAAVGIHPHHVNKLKMRDELLKIERLLEHEKVVAVGEVGLDRHVYKKTKYDHYFIDNAFIELQKEFFKKQIELALRYNQSLILHNREASEDFLEILQEKWDKKMAGRTVFHCCEPKAILLDFAVKHNIYIGVDGDVTYNLLKQKLVKQIPLEFLVLETDSPFLTPQPLRSSKRFPNEPANISYIAQNISQVRRIPLSELLSFTVKNGQRLFNL